MSAGSRSKMMRHEIFLLVTCVTLSAAIRVDFGTKTGPIVPPTPTTTVRPQMPYRNPAPVWEDQSDDIPNPNPYQYVLPPPSRPKPLTNNYKQSTRQQTPREFVFGQIISPSDVNTLYSPTVASLSPQYIPNFGFKYSAVVPANPKKYYAKKSEIYFNDKFNKNNAKTKKYKGYEKAKYVPEVYYANVFEVPSLSLEQQLPLLQAPQPFRLPVITHTPPPRAFNPPKSAYTKDELNGISKNYKTHQSAKQNSFSYNSNKIRR